MSKKGENIRKRKDGRWEGRYKKGYKNNGNTIYGSVYGKTYREVKIKLQTVIASPPTDLSQSAKEMTFAELLTLWQDANKIRLKGSTQYKYANLINTHIIPALDISKFPKSKLRQSMRFSRIGCIGDG